MDDLEDESAFWGQQRLTKLAHKRLQQMIDSAWCELEGRCAISEDPQVAMAYGRWKALKEHAAFYASLAVRNKELRLARKEEHD